MQMTMRWLFGAGATHPVELTSLLSATSVSRRSCADMLRNWLMPFQHMLVLANFHLHPHKHLRLMSIEGPAHCPRASSYNSCIYCQHEPGRRHLKVPLACSRYFRYTRMTLPPEYNTLSEHVVWRLMTGYPHYDALPAPPMSPKQLRVVSDAGGRVGSRGWWGRGRRSLLGGSVFDEPEWTLTALTPGGADVSILHHAVEEKPWHRRACQDARKHGIPWPYGLGRE